MAQEGKVLVKNSSFNFMSYQNGRIVTKIFRYTMLGDFIIIIC